MTENEYDSHLEKMIYGNNKKQEKIAKQKELIKETDIVNDNLNKKAENMINEIDTILEKTESINGNINENIENIDIYDIENIELDDSVDS